MHRSVSIIMIPVVLILAICPAFAQTAPACPFEVEEGMSSEASLLVGRLDVVINATNARSADGTQTLFDPHVLVETRDFKEWIAWSEGEQTIAVLIAEDPVLLAPASMEAAARHGAAKRFGHDFAAGASVLHLEASESLGGAVAVGGMMEDNGWAVSVAVVLPNGRLLYVAAMLVNPYSQDEDCRAAAMQMLAGMQSGVRGFTNKGERKSVDLLLGGTLKIPRVNGYAPFTRFGIEESAVALRQLVPFEERLGRAEIHFVVSQLFWEEPSAPDWSIVATTRLLGESAQWQEYPDAPDIEMAWVRGMYEGKRGGVIRIETYGESDEQRAYLRDVARRFKLRR